MNRKLLDPFEPEYPESIEACLDDEYAVKCAFSHNGSFLATARSDGWCYIWDMDTLNVMRKLNHGESALLGLSWSRSGRYILTYDEAGVCIVWDLRTERIRARVEFESAVACARMHPRNSMQFVVCLAREAPCLVTIGSDESMPPTVIPIRISAESVDQKSKAAASTCCCFGKKGVYVFFGTSKGAVHAVLMQTLNVVCSTKLSASTVNTISRNPRGSDIVTSSSDRILRVCEVFLPGQATRRKVVPENTPPSISVTTKIQDIVNRVHWAQALFSASGDYIVSGIQHKAEHNIYIWDKFTGSLVKMLTGPNELLEDCTVHPLRAIYASISTFGIIYMWTRVPQQNWNAFAPGFKELEENIDFTEPEDIFDRRLTKEDGGTVDCIFERIQQDKRDAAGSDESDINVEVDITDDDPLFSDSDTQSDDDEFVLPVLVKSDDLSMASEIPVSESPMPPSQNGETFEPGLTITES
ncbi:chromatin binding protein [Coemansia sp. RSA 1250]|nr:chromatin binding protein [Coemansia sp. RSA 1250]